VGQVRLDRIDVDAVARLVERMQTAQYRAEVGRRLPNFHELRHAHASAWICPGGNLVELSARLGHRDPAVTASIYSHEFEAQARSSERRAPLDAIYGPDTDSAAGDPTLTPAVA
jgi:integrase